MVYTSPMKPCHNSYYWNPWIGCDQYSEGCEHCYVKPHNNFISFFFDFERSEKKSGDWVAVCLASDFFIEKADEFRDLAWAAIRNNPDLMFFIITKRVERILDCLPSDWGEGWDNVILCATAENKKRVEERIPLFCNIPCKHRWITCSPLLEEVSLATLLEGGKIEAVQCTGERFVCGFPTRPTEYSWVEKLSNECKKAKVRFSLNYLGDNFIMPDGEIKRHWCGWFENDVEDQLQLYNYIPYKYTLNGVEYSF